MKSMLLELIFAEIEVDWREGSVCWMMMMMMMMMVMMMMVIMIAICWHAN